MVRTLLGRGLISEAYTDSETGAIHYETTDLLLTQLGINSLDELPHISPAAVDGIGRIRGASDRCDERRHRASPRDAPAGPTGERLQKVLAAAGVASRRVCEQYIAEGRVSVNGEIVTELGSRVDPAVDLVAVDGVAVQLDATKRYLMLNKPRGVVSSMEDETRSPRPAPVPRRRRGARLQRGPARRRHDRAAACSPTTARSRTCSRIRRSGSPRPTSRPSAARSTAQTIQKLKNGIELDDGPIAADKAKIVGEPSGGNEPRRDHAALGAQPHRAADAGGRRAPGARARAPPVRAAAPRKRSASGRIRDLTKVELGQLLTLSREPGSRRHLRRPDRRPTTPSEDRMNARMRGQVRVVGAGLLGASIGLGLARARRRRDPRRRVAARTSPWRSTTARVARPAADDAPALVVVAVPPDVGGRRRRGRARRASGSARDRCRERQGRESSPSCVESRRRRHALPRLAPDGGARTRGSGLRSRRPVPRAPLGHHAPRGDDSRAASRARRPRPRPRRDARAHDARRARSRGRARVARAAARRVAARRAAASGESTPPSGSPGRGCATRPASPAATPSCGCRSSPPTRPRSPRCCAPTATTSTA